MSKSKIKLTNGVFCSLSELPIKENLLKLDSAHFLRLPKVSYFAKFTHDFCQGFEDNCLALGVWFKSAIWMLAPAVKVNNRLILVKPEPLSLPIPIYFPLGKNQSLFAGLLQGRYFFTKNQYNSRYS